MISILPYLEQAASPAQSHQPGAIYPFWSQLAPKLPSLSPVLALVSLELESWIQPAPCTQVASWRQFTSWTPTIMQSSKIEDRKYRQTYR
uniref:Uncharacterized protein n=1 Tax=Gadus morhua TaxID=8049 RepID=A0A8C5C0X0_GADMO